MSTTRLSTIMTSALLIGVTFASFLLSSLSTAYAASKKATAATSTAQVLAPQPDFCTNLYDKSQDDREKLIKEMATGICQGNNSPQCIAKESAKIVKGCVAKSTGQQQDGESCKDSYDKFQKEDKELRAACSSVPIDGDCFTHVNKCLKCQGSDSTDSICASLETEEIDSDLDPDSKPASISDYLNAGQSTSASTTKYTPDRKKAAIRYKNCPAMAGTDLEKWITRVRDAQTAASDSKKRIIELQEKNNDIEAQLNDTKIEKQKEMQDAATEAEDAKQQMLNDMDKEKNEARKTVAALLEQSTVIENQIAATQKAYDDAYRTYLDAMAKLDDLCYAEAKQKLAAAQIAAQEKIKNSQYSTNSLNSLLGQVGISSRVKAQSRVNEDFRFCKRDPTHQAQITMAKRALDSAKQAANQARQSLEAKKIRLLSPYKMPIKGNFPRPCKEWWPIPIALWQSSRKRFNNWPLICKMKLIKLIQKWPPTIKISLSHVRKPPWPNKLFSNINHISIKKWSLLAEWKLIQKKSPRP